ncbi:hypothetical protein [Aeromonas sp. s5]|uniref:hypothetical protein n=1 Tax=Aeromonas sp. s5 TaxID=3138487 RepID=UPI0034A23815
MKRNNQTATWRILPAIIVSLPASVLAMDGERGDPGNVIIPITSTQINKNTCSEWEIQQTYTATLMPRSTIDSLSQYNSFSTDNHYHAGLAGTSDTGVWYTTIDMSGTPEMKLNRINREIFGTSNPPPGTVVTFRNSHNGYCAADQNMRECVGVFVHAVKGKHVTPERVPTTLPDGFCVGIPPADISCSFSTNNALIDLGTGGMGKRAGRASVSYSCTRPTMFRVSMVPHNADRSGIQIDAVRVDGQPLPASGTYQSGTQQMQVDVEAVVSELGKVGTSRVLYIDIP